MARYVGKITLKREVMERPQAAPRPIRTVPLFPSANPPAQPNPIPSSSPAFSAPVHPIRSTKPSEAPKPSILPIILPPATLRPLAFRTFTKKHNLSLTSSALQLFATFVGKHCGSGWREEGLAEKVLDEAAKIWKKNGGAVIVPGDGDELKTILKSIESSMWGGKPSQQSGLSRHGGYAFGAQDTNGDVFVPNDKAGTLTRHESIGMSALNVDDAEERGERQDPREWLKVVNAFEQPRLIYNVHQKHFEIATNPPSFLPDPSNKTHLFRHRCNLIHQRLLRNESFQISAVAKTRSSFLQRSSSTMTTAQQAYKLTPIANLLGRSGSSHILLGLLTISPTGMLTVNDLTGSIMLDIKHARPAPEDGAWFTPGMVVLVDGVYEEEGTKAGPGLESNAGVGSTIGGCFIVFSIGGPPCERREVTLGISNAGGDGNSAGGGFGWVDFLGVGSERASGSAMRRLERNVLRRKISQSSEEGRGRMIILGDVNLDSAKTLQALRKVLGIYAAEPADQTPMCVVLMGNFVRYAAMAGGGSGGSIEYKEYFNSLASALSDYPTMLQNTTFIFVPGDNDPWASAFSAGAATVLPRSSLPELFTSRVNRAFANANTDAEKSTGNRTDGQAIWSTNPTRITLFGPAQEVVLFRDNISGRLRRNAVRFKPLAQKALVNIDSVVIQGSDAEILALNQEQASSEGMDVDPVVETAQSRIPAPKIKGFAESHDLHAARKLVKTILDQGYLSPFPLFTRPVLWDHVGSLQLYPLPTALVLMDPEAPPFAITYQGCHVMNPGSLTSPDRRGVAQWVEYDARTRLGKSKEARY